MINHINTSGPWLTGANGSNSLPYIPANSNPMQGVVRTVNNCLEAWTGSNWVSLSGGSVFLDMSDHAKSVLKWAECKMMEEQRLAELAKTNPTVADAMKTYQDAEAKLKMVLVLAEQSK